MWVIGTILQEQCTEDVVEFWIAVVGQDLDTNCACSPGATCFPFSLLLCCTQGGRRQTPESARMVACMDFLGTEVFLAPVFLFLRCQLAHPSSCLLRHAQLQWILSMPPTDSL